MPQAAIRRALRGLASGPDALLTEYGNSLGPLNLRRILARQFAEEGLDISLETILLTASGSQAVDLICRYLLRPPPPGRQSFDLKDGQQPRQCVRVHRRGHEQAPPV